MGEDRVGRQTGRQEDTKMNPSLSTSSSQLVESQRGFGRAMDVEGPGGGRPLGFGRQLPPQLSVGRRPLGGGGGGGGGLGGAVPGGAPGGGGGVGGSPAEKTNSCNDTLAALPATPCLLPSLCGECFPGCLLPSLCGNFFCGGLDLGTHGYGFGHGDGRMNFCKGNRPLT